MSESLPATTEAPTAVSLFDGALRPQHLKFALAYIGEANFNATKAALLAGYPEKSAHARGHEVKNREDVRARVDAYLNEYGMTANEWLYQTTAVARMPLDEFVTIHQYDKDGNAIGAKMDASAKMKGLELIGKAHGLLSDKMDVNVELTRRVLIGMSPEDFDAEDDVIEAEIREVGDDDDR